LAVFVHPKEQPEGQREQVAVIPTGVRVVLEDGRLAVYDAEDQIVGNFGPVFWWYAGHTSPDTDLSLSGVPAFQNGHQGLDDLPLR
jgi:hypothetical protein